VLDLDEAIAAPHARGRLPGGPLRLAGAAPPPRRPAPGLGQHTDEVLAAAGYSASEIERLRGAGAVA
jgi:crotonobetainyl-CoA:carnitine CoA-transferase CaiB-like acyl-CoA transferase